uniref:MENTAL domain-containing protein n=1 Tax=Globodera rostochiensis TaxID=31243 RepID=A0A914HS44_GLORO
MNEMPPTLPLPLHAEVVFLIILIIEHNPSALLLHNREPGRHEQGPYKNSSLEAFVEKVDIFRPYFLYNSLFDLAIAAFLRMSVLLVAYALIKCDHWFPVALTTAGTTIFVATKIFFFFDKDKSQMQQPFTSVPP